MWRRTTLAFAVAVGVMLLAGLPLSISGAADPAPGSSYRLVEVQPNGAGRAGFTAMPPAQTGIVFTNVLATERHLTNQILLNGSGVACGDVDGDGWTDVYFCGLDGPNRLYRNLGNWRFQDITEAAGVACPGLDASAAALADLEGDGDLDLVVSSLGGGTQVFYSDGRAHFSRAPFTLNGGKGGSSLALGDLDGDGFLDLYQANYRTTALMDMPNTRFWLKTVNGRRVVDSVNDRPATDPAWTNRFVVNARGGIAEQGEVDVLYRNIGGTRFEPVPFTGGRFLDEEGWPLAQEPFDWGLTAAIRDLDGDSRPDIYVCNDFDSPDRIWLNLGDGRFRALPRLALRKTSFFTMSLDFADINRDGFDDFVLLDMLNRRRVNRLVTMPERRSPALQPGEWDDRPQYMQTMLCLNRGDTTYAEIAPLAGVEASDWAWSAVFLDVDLDGWEDLLIANGNERDGRNMDVAAQLRELRTKRAMTPREILEARRLFPDFHTPNLAFRNRGDLRFEEVGKRWGFDYVGVSQGMALADLDNDGDLDVVMNNLNGAAGLFRNDSPAPRLAVRLNGRAPNTRGIGAKIKVLGGPVPAQTQEIGCGGRYLSSDDPMRTFACGTATNLTIEVAWRSGARSVVSNVPANRVCHISEPAAPSPVPVSKPPPPHFREVSRLLAHRHAEQSFDDFERDPLLPHRLSQLGPGVSWTDLDGDGWDELSIGSGAGGQLAVFKNDGRGGFARWAGPPLQQAVPRDQTTILGWRKSDGSTVLLAGASNYEDGSTTDGIVQEYDLRRRIAEVPLPGGEASVGPLAMADVDGDGLLDLFVGARVVPGRYPAPASSLLFRNSGGRLVKDEENGRRLSQTGLVSGAVFSDLDSDGDPDLILACEWGPLRIFRNERGELTPWDWAVTIAAVNSPPAPRPMPLNPQPSTLNQLTGWWNGVTTGDFDGDGRLDVVASNWGRNTRFESHRARPLRLWYGDFRGDGTVQSIEACFDAEFGQWMPERGLNTLAAVLPFLREQFGTHRAFAEASLEQILDQRLSAASVLEARWLDTTVFLNRGSHFEARPLPLEAQFAPAFGLSVADLDGDGAEDVFLSQNFFGVTSETPRYDAGRGLWLKGDGRGDFVAIDGDRSGIKVYGEQRGCALSDYDGDGRVDLVVTQNGAETKLYHNEGARPGLRVRLAGPPGNLDGVGAVIRAGTGPTWGPAREIHAGAGYWSQDSVVQVLGGATTTRLEVKWPGGKTTVTTVPAGTSDLAVNPAGLGTRIR